MKPILNQNNNEYNFLTLQLNSNFAPLERISLVKIDGLLTKRKLICILQNRLKRLTKLKKEKIKIATEKRFLKFKRKKIYIAYVVYEKNENVLKFFTKKMLQDLKRKGIKVTNNSITVITS